MTMHKSTGLTRRSFLAGGGALLAGAAAGAAGIATATGCSASSDEQGKAGGYRPGTYTATSDSRSDSITLETTVTADSIESVTITRQNETSSIAASALKYVPLAIVDGQTLNVDGIAGATFTSNAILSAVENCISQAGGDPETLKKADPAPASRSLTAGTYQAIAHGHHSDVEVEVVLGPDAIDSVTILSSGETYNLSYAATDTVPNAIVEKQTTGVDAVSGATFTSRAIQSAVENCLEQAGGIKAVRAFGARAEPDPWSKDETTVDTDVVVVGSGMSGIAAALSAQESGAKVALVEKMPFWGGTSQTVRGYFAIATDDSAQAIDDYYQYGLHMHCGIMKGETEDAEYPNKDLLYTLAANSWAATKWIEGMGAKLEWSTKPAPFPNQPEYYRSDAHFVSEQADDGPDVVGLNFQILLDNFVEKGGEIYLDAPMTEILTDSANAVVGIKAAGRSGSYTFNAKSVVLTCGGFSASQAAIEKYAPSYAGEESTTLVGNVGEGIMLAEKIGAAVYDNGMLFAQCGHTIVNDYAMIHPYADNVTPMTSIYVNNQGLRVNSEDPVKYSPGSCYVYPDQQDFYWAIINEETAGQTEYLDILKEQLAEGNERFYTAETLADLAKLLRITPNTLRYTLNRYNGFCATGVDEDFAKKAELLVPMEQGPWYAVKCVLKYFGGIGGLKTNTDGAVLDTDENIIPGLFAAGENANGGFFNLTYPGARSMTVCLTMGMIAGAAAAKQ